MPGYTPDYASLIANDPTLKQIQADISASNISDIGSRNAAINRALVSFGSVPDLQAAGQSLGLDLTGVVDPTTGQLAANNPYSTEANLATQHTQAIRQIRQALAARGGLQSGELGYQVGNENTAYGQAQTGATQALLDLIGQAQSGYTDAQREAQAQLNAARQSAADRQATLNPPTGSQTASYDPDMSGKAGHPVYKGPDGSYYNVDGSAYTPTASPTTAPNTTGVDPNTGLPTAPHVMPAAPSFGNVHYFGSNF